jgi:hypothetical protein
VIYCQFNVAWMKQPYTDPVWHRWKTELVPRVHAIARATPGFVALYDGLLTAAPRYRWRRATDDGRGRRF